MTTEKPPYDVSPAVEATIMTAVAIHEGVFGVKSLSRHLGRPAGTVSKGVQVLQSKDWVRAIKSDVRVPRGGHPGMRLYSTDLFQRAAQEANESIGYLTASDQVHFQAGATAYVLAHGGENAAAKDAARIMYLGTSALLNERYDLNAITGGGWFRGEAGWRALMALRASGVVGGVEG